MVALLWHHALLDHFEGSAATSCRHGHLKPSTKLVVFDLTSVDLVLRQLSVGQH